MRHLVTLAIVAVLGTGATALAQTPSGQVPGAAPRNGTAESVLPRLNLTQQQKQAVGRGLSSQPSQNAAADVQMSVGKPLPRSMTPQAMPNSVTQQVARDQELRVRQAAGSCGDGGPDGPVDRRDHPAPRQPHHWSR